jgi:hypothetical protein
VTSPAKPPSCFGVVCAGEEGFLAVFADVDVDFDVEQCYQETDGAGNRAAARESRRRSTRRFLVRPRPACFQRRISYIKRQAGSPNKQRSGVRRAHPFAARLYLGMAL